VRASCVLAAELAVAGLGLARRTTALATMATFFGRCTTCFAIAIEAPRGCSFAAYRLALAESRREARRPAHGQRELPEQGAAPQREERLQPEDGLTAMPTRKGTSGQAWEGPPQSYAEHRWVQFRHRQVQQGERSARPPQDFHPPLRLRSSSKPVIWSCESGVPLELGLRDARARSWRSTSVSDSPRIFFRRAMIAQLRSMR
jgi:hypothetical protein